MFRNGMPRYEILSEDAMSTLDWRLAPAGLGDRRGVR